MTRIRNSITLAKASWEVLKSDKDLLLLPVISGAASLTIAATFILPIIISGSTNNIGITLMAVAYFALAYITIFFNAALIHAANERLQGGDPTLRTAIRGAAKKAGKILPWAILSAVVSVILRAIEERVGFLGQIVTAIAGMAWTAVTFLVLPIIVIEGIGTGQAVKKSGGLLKTTWGENLAAQIGFGLIGFLLILPAIVLVIAALTVAGVAGAIVAGSLAVIWGLTVAVVLSALSAIYQTALYHYAVNGNVPHSQFDNTTMSAAFAPKRRRRSAMRGW